MTGELAPLSRLVLAYAPARSRADWLTLLALDARLAGVVRQAREPMLAQMRLAWWRDRFAADPAGWPKGEPLLRRLAEWGEPAAALEQLVDGWEALLGEGPLGEGALNTFAQGRVAALAALARRLDSSDAAVAVAVAPVGLRWALADLALHLGDASERDCAVRILANAPTGGRVPKAMRPLAVLAGLSERAVKRGAGDALDGPRSLLAAIRLGIIGS